MAQLGCFRCRLRVRGAGSFTVALSAALAVSSAAPALPASAQQQVLSTSDAAPAALEVATVKPSKPEDRGRRLHPSGDRITIENFTLKELIAYAYDLKDNSQVVGGPNWLDRSHFDIAGVASEVEAARLRAMTVDDQRREWGGILQPFLAERFGLKVNREKRTMAMYALVAAKSGTKQLKASPADKAQSTAWGDRRMIWTATSMDDLAFYLTRVEGRVVTDRTGLAGHYDFTLNWSWDEDAASQAFAADLMTALHEQLGLELKPEKGLVPVLVVKSANAPELDK